MELQRERPIAAGIQGYIASKLAEYSYHEPTRDTQPGKAKKGKGGRKWRPGDLDMKFGIQGRKV